MTLPAKDATPAPASKPAWQSKTLWTNVAAAIGAIANGRYDLAVLAGLNIVLRFITSQPITVDPSAK